jgi:hypothetical protein
METVRQKLTRCVYPRIPIQNYVFDCLQIFAIDMNDLAGLLSGRRTLVQFYTRKV